MSQCPYEHDMCCYNPEKNKKNVDGIMCEYCEEGIKHEKLKVCVVVE